MGGMSVYLLVSWVVVEIGPAGVRGSGSCSDKMGWVQRAGVGSSESVGCGRKREGRGPP